MVTRMGDRGRVPFALVGVVLLVSSAAFQASLGAAPAAREPATEIAIDRAGASVVPAVRTAVRQATRRAAADPVVTPANTSAGRALNSSRPFRDALRLRIYLAVHDRLAATTTTERRVRANATLPAVTSTRTAEVRAAIDRVELRRTGASGSRIRVRISNVSLRAHREGDVVTRERLDPTVTVDTPVLALHDRVERYEQRLDARTLSPDSAGARLTAGAYLVAYGRGTAQWAGAPITNVVANRHLALATDAAVYDAQARTFGARDPEWQEGIGTATRRALGKDAADAVFEATKRRQSPRTGLVMDALKRHLLSESATQSRGPTGPFARDSTTVRVGRHADAALAAMLRKAPGEGENLTEILRTAYTVDARVVARTEGLGTTRSGRAGPPDSSGDWRLVEQRRETVRHTRNRTTAGTTASPPIPDDWHRLHTANRRVVERETIIRRWRDGDGTATTRQRINRRHRVSMAVVGRHSGDGLPSPQRAIRPVHERGGPLDGPNLEDVSDRATARLVAERGGYSTLARNAVAGGLDTEPVPVTGTSPATLRRWVRADLFGLHQRVRNVSVRTSRRELATLESAAATELAATLEARQRELIDPPRSYRGIADRARVAARAAYLDRVVAGLESRAEREQRARKRLNRSLASSGFPSLDRIERLRATAANVTGDSEGGATENPRFVPDATPTHLSLSEVSRSRVGLRGGGDVRPLAARNTNLFTLPYGDLVSSALDTNRTVPLSTAARTLRSTRGASGANGTNGSLVETRGRLRGAVVAANDHLRSRARGVLRRRGVADVTRRRDIVGAGLSRWDSPSGRALAFANGSAATAIAAAAVDNRTRHRPDGQARQTRMRLLLQAEFRRALRDEAGQVSRRPAERTGRLARDLGRVVAGEVTKRTVEHGAQRVKERAYGSAARTVPAGLPVLPPVAPWVATVNVWQVQVRGVHPSLVVRARGQGRPGPPPSYERDGRPVRLDIDGDGDPDRLGRATRVAFDIETTVLVVVPPGGRGVGDTDGNADERTGWPTPEPWPSGTGVAAGGAERPVVARP